MEFLPGGSSTLEAGKQLNFCFPKPGWSVALGWEGRAGFLGLRSAPAPALLPGEAGRGSAESPGLPGCASHSFHRP